MNNIHWLKIEGQCGNETQIWINIPKGLTKEQADDFGKRLDEIVNEYGERHDEDYACFDYHAAIDEAANDLKIKYDYPPTDYTIYV